MSTYSKQTKHPITGEWHEATWIDDFYGRHRYGVRFPDGETFNPEKTKLETREDDPMIPNYVDKLNLTEKITVEVEVHDVANIEFYRKALAIGPLFFGELDNLTIVFGDDCYNYNHQIAQFLQSQTEDEIKELKTLVRISSLKKELLMLEESLTNNE